MLNLKYIVYWNGISEVMVMFDPSLRHVDVTVGLRAAGQVRGAGLVDLETRRCFGDSYTLMVASRPEDTELLKCYFGD